MLHQLQVNDAESALEALDEIDVAAIRALARAMDLAHGTRAKRLRQLRAFLSHTLAAGWMVESPAFGIRAQKRDAEPTMPLTLEETQALVSTSRHQPRQYALLLVRYSGLAIMDAVTLSGKALKQEVELVLLPARSGELEMVAIPYKAVAALGAAAPAGPAGFFWTGRSEPGMAANHWRTRLNSATIDAGDQDFHPHRLRDDFNSRITSPSTGAHSMSSYCSRES